MSDFPPTIYVRLERSKDADDVLLVELDPGDLPIAEVSAVYVLQKLVRADVFLKDVKPAKKTR